MKYYVHAYAEPGGNGIVFDEDKLGEKRSTKTIAGPFVSGFDADRIVY